MEPNTNDTGKLIRNLALFIGIPLVCFLVVSLFWGMRPASKEAPYSTYVNYFKDNKVEEFSLNLGNGKLKLLLREEYREDVNRDGQITERDVISYTVPNVSVFLNDIEDYRKEFVGNE